MTDRLHCCRPLACGRTPALLCLALCLTLGAFGCATSASHGETLHGAVLTSAVPKPDETLTDTSGQPFDLSSPTTGRVTLLYFGYTHCPDICPAHMATIAAALRRLPAGVAKQVQVVFVTTDPARDTPAVIRSWLDNFSPSFIGLTGDETTLDRAEMQVGMPPASKEDLGNGEYAVDHAAYVLAYTPDNLAHVVYPAGVSQTDWVHDLTTLVKNGWKGS